MDEAEIQVLKTKIEPQLISKTATSLGINLGKQWRLFEGPFPNVNSPVCVQVQLRKGTEWTTVAAFGPDGTDAKACVARYAMATGQTLTNNTEQVLNFPQKDQDSDSAVTTGTAWNFKVPVGKGGLYFVIVCVEINWNFAAAGQLSYHIARKNAVKQYATGVFVAQAAAQGISTLITGSAMLTANAGDLIDVVGFQNSGANNSYANNAQNNFIHIVRMPFTPNT
jgi:hypothetical protein